jgi:ABC-type transporter Mla subunit MlaD
MASGIDAAGRTATGAMAGTVSEAINAIDLRLKNMNDQMAGFVNQIGESTLNTVNRMGTGTDTLNTAVGEFSKATQDLTNVLAGTATTTNALTQSAESMTLATRALDGIVGDYRANRDVLDRMLTELRVVVENAKKESSLTTDFLTRIDSAATKLSQAQLQAEQYLDKISEVLGEAHQEFSDNMRNTLGEANRQFYDQLTQATGLLRTGILELETTLSALEPKK